MLTEPVWKGTVLTGGAHIVCRLYGTSGPVLFLLHGNGEDYTYFDKQLNAFSQHCRVLTMDSRGHGASDFGSEKLTIDQIALDALAVLDALGIARAIPVGFSDGGNVALAMALKAPERLDAMVLAGANLCPIGVKPSAQLPTILAYLFFVMGTPFSETLRRRRRICRLMVKEPHFSDRQVTAVRVKTLVLAGERDLIRPAHSKKIARLLGADLKIVQGADHFIFEKQPAFVNQTILRFVETSRYQHS